MFMLVEIEDGSSRFRCPGPLTNDLYLNSAITTLAPNAL
jgi:hypothetical protein